MAKKKRHVTRREAQAVASYAAAVMQAMRMPQWNILVMEDPCDDDSQAVIKWVDQRYVAQLHLSKDWMSYPSHVRRESVTHEVLHLMHSRVSTVAIDDTAHLMHDHEHHDYVRRLTREFELMVDHLASFMADTHNLEEAWDEAHQQ